MLCIRHKEIEEQERAAYADETAEAIAQASHMERSRVDGEGLDGRNFYQNPNSRTKVMEQTGRLNGGKFQE